MARKTTYDQEKVKELRMSLIDACSLIMKDDPKAAKFSQLKIDLIMRMSSRVLPQVNEISGPEGTPIPLLNLTNVLSNNSPKESSTVKQED